MNDKNGSSLYLLIYAEPHGQEHQTQSNKLRAKKDNFKTFWTFEYTSSIIKHPHPAQLSTGKSQILQTLKNKFWSFPFNWTFLRNTGKKQNRNYAWRHFAKYKYKYQNCSKNFTHLAAQHNKNDPQYVFQTHKYSTIKKKQIQRSQ